MRNRRLQALLWPENSARVISHPRRIRLMLNEDRQYSHATTLTFVALLLSTVLFLVAFCGKQHARNDGVHQPEGSEPPSVADGEHPSRNGVPQPEGSEPPS